MRRLRDPLDRGLPGQAAGLHLDVERVGLGLDRLGDGTQGVDAVINGLAVQRHQAIRADATHGKAGQDGKEEELVADAPRE